MQWDVFTKLSTLQVQIHWTTAVMSLALAVMVLLLKKGTAIHRLLGRLFVLCMVSTSLAAFFIRDLDQGESWQFTSKFSWIHLFIPLTLGLLTLSIISIRRGQVKKHYRYMIATIVGGLLIAGGFTFSPGRHMHTLFFGDPSTVQRMVDEGDIH